VIYYLLENYFKTVLIVHSVISLFEIKVAEIIPVMSVYMKNFNSYRVT
jgi:hypothetical protein